MSFDIFVAHYNCQFLVYVNKYTFGINMLYLYHILLSIVTTYMKA